MSNHSLNAPHSQPQSSPNPSSSTPLDLAALAEKFHEATQALLAFCRAGSPEQANIVDEKAASPDDADLSDDEGDEDESADDQGETRSYYFSPFTLKNERKLLKEYEAEDFRDLLFEAHISLSGMVELMKNIDMETKLNSTVVYSLGCLLERVSLLVFKIQDAYSTMEPIEA